jgi:hypothetical protein
MVYKKGFTKQNRLLQELFFANEEVDVKYLAERVGDSIPRVYANLDNLRKRDLITKVRKSNPNGLCPPKIVSFKINHYRQDKVRWIIMKCKEGEAQARLEREQLRSQNEN